MRFRPYNIWTDSPRNSVLAMDRLRYLFASRLVKKPQSDVIDLGCGDGMMSYLLARVGHRVTAVDGSRERLAKFEELARSLGINQVLSDFAGLEPGSLEADYVICLEVLEHMEDPDLLLNVIHSFLRPKGMAIISVPLDEEIFEGYVECPKCGHAFHRDGHVQSFRPQDLRRIASAHHLETRKSYIFQSVFTRQLQMALHANPGRLLLAADRVFCRVFPRLGRRFFVVCEPGTVA